jgi:hypothetical protein
MFDYRFIKLLLNFVEYYHECRNHRANYHNMESLVRNNYRKILKGIIAPCGNNDREIFFNNYMDFVEYYDAWYFSF